MNLRHTKPSHSYSESAPLLKMSEVRIKQDPMLKNYAQILVNFIQKANQKYFVYQDIIKKKRGNRECRKKSPYRKKILRNLNDSTKRSKMFHMQPRGLFKAKHTQDVEQKCKSNFAQDEDLEFPPQFIQALLDLYQYQEQEEETQADDPTVTIKSKLQKMCHENPQYGVFLDELYARTYFIEGFHP